MSDVNYDRSPAMQAARGQTYGKATEQLESQRAVPMARQPVETQAAQAARRPQPATPGSFLAPTARPEEPITAGAPFGEGPGPMFGMTEAEMMDDALMELRAIYNTYPSQELADIIQFYEDAL